MGQCGLERLEAKHRVDLGAVPDQGSEVDAGAQRIDYTAPLISDSIRIWFNDRELKPVL